MRGGYTLIELLVVVAISAMLAAIAVSYTGVARHESALSVESAQIADTILHARNLSIATYGSLNQSNSPRICGYGVSVGYANNTFSLFAYVPQPSRYPALKTNANGYLEFCPSVASTTAAGIVSGLYSSGGEKAPYSTDTWHVPIVNGVRLSNTGVPSPIQFVLFIPPAPTTLMVNGNAVPFNITSGQLLLVTSDGAASTEIKLNSAGQVTF